MKVLLINNPTFTSYTTLALTPHNEQTGFMCRHTLHMPIQIFNNEHQDVCGLCLALYLAT